MEATGAEALQQGKGQRRQESQQSLQSKACRCQPLRGGREVRKAAATALQEWVCVVSPTTGLALLALMAHPPSHNRDSSAERLLLGTGGWAVPAAAQEALVWPGLSSCSTLPGLGVVGSSDPGVGGGLGWGQVSWRSQGVW